jgi:hypothetical protein|tara:strand:- start:7 stop:594 length:588 start_codon:yes stop_codon:yes gene_type:complete
MKQLLLILILTLSFQLGAKADDINEFEIEGMSIGDSLLNHVTLSEIKIFEKNPTYYKNNKFITILVDINLEQYERLQVVYKPDDKRFILHEIKGLIDYEKNIDECKELKETVSVSLINLFNNPEIISEIKPHAADKSNMSTSDSTVLYPKDGGFVHIACTNYSIEMNEKHGWRDSFQVTIGSDEFRLWLANEEYK